MMRQKAGSIINMASVVGVHGNAGQANYSASKAGMIALAKSIAQELGSRGIRANAIAPGFIITAMTDALSDEVKAEWPWRYARRRGQRGYLPGIRHVVLRFGSGDPDRRWYEHVMQH